MHLAALARDLENDNTSVLHICSIQQMEIQNRSREHSQVAEKNIQTILIKMLDNFIYILNKMGEELIDEYRKQLANNGHDATGSLANSVTFTITTTDSSFEITLDLLDYWEYVENGRSPGKFPPPDAILNWIHTKPIIPREISGKLPTEDQLAFLIGHKISEEGTQGTHDMETALNIIKSRYEPLLSEALQDDYNKYALELIMHSKFNNI